MKPRSTIFLQVVIVLIGIMTLIIMIRFPLTEGRAKNLDLLHIYLDLFILYAYVASVAFFVALYHAFRLLGYIRQNTVFSYPSVKAVRNIKYCAFMLGMLIVLAGIFIRIFHAQDDDPAGFLALSMVATFIAIVAAIAAGVVEKILQLGLEVKSENEQLHGLLKQ